MNTGFLGPAVATVLTVYGIETRHHHAQVQQQLPQVATVLTVYGIETSKSIPDDQIDNEVATVLTVYGIETFFIINQAFI